MFKRGAEALSKGEYGAAIDDFESLADQGFAHPDASYDRGLAYVMRVHAGADRPGDLGRAAAAFEETLLLRPGDRDADLALDHVRAEVTRRRARKSKDEVAVRPSLDRLVVGLASEQAWGLSALAASLLFSVGLVLWRRTGRAHLVGAVLAPTAAVALLIFIPLTWGAHHLRVATRPGVVVTSEVTDVEVKGNFPAAPKKGDKISFKWVVKGDVATLSDFKGDGADGVGPVVGVAAALEHLAVGGLGLGGPDLVAAEVADAVGPRERLGAGADDQAVGRALHDEAGEQDGVAHGGHAGDGAGAEVAGAHDRGVVLEVPVAVHAGAAAGVEGREAAPVERVHQPRASKSIRGSTNVYIRSPRIPMTRPIRPKKKSVPNMIG